MVTPRSETIARWAGYQHVALERKIISWLMPCPKVEYNLLIVLSLDIAIVDLKCVVMNF
jgi:hypothetical protein